VPGAGFRGIENLAYHEAQEAAAAYDYVQESLTEVITQARDLHARIQGGVVPERDARKLLADLRKQCAELVAKIASTKSRHYARARYCLLLAPPPDAHNGAQKVDKDIPDNDQAWNGCQHVLQDHQCPIFGACHPALEWPDCVLDQEHPAIPNSQPHTIENNIHQDLGQEFGALQRFSPKRLGLRRADRSGHRSPFKYEGPRIPGAKHSRRRSGLGVTRCEPRRAVSDARAKWRMSWWGA
jgi:hypothetical protein